MIRYCSMPGVGIARNGSAASNDCRNLALNLPHTLWRCRHRTTKSFKPRFAFLFFTTVAFKDHKFLSVMGKQIPFLLGHCREYHIGLDTFFLSSSSLNFLNWHPENTHRLHCHRSLTTLKPHQYWLPQNVIIDEFMYKIIMISLHLVFPPLTTVWYLKALTLFQYTVYAYIIHIIRKLNTLAPVNI